MSSTDTKDIEKVVNRVPAVTNVVEVVMYEPDTFGVTIEVSPSPYVNAADVVKAVKKAVEAILQLGERVVVREKKP